MMINVICFTERGARLSEKIVEKFEKSDLSENRKKRYTFTLYEKYESFDQNIHPGIIKVTDSLSEWTYKRQEARQPIIFIAACGIAVRAIAKGIRGKLQDAPVLVIDELGIYVIPLLAGHMGGANEMAIDTAGLIGAIPVITTATDLEGCFSIDLWARENGLKIENKKAIARVSAKALDNKPVRISIENFPSFAADVIVSSDKAVTDVIVSSDKAVQDDRKLFLKSNGSDISLCPKEYALGIGCRKATEVSALENFISDKLRQLEISFEEIGSMASIDLKADEKAILELSHKYRIPFITFTSELLERAAGDYEESSFVKEKTGVGNVCERAAMLLTNNSGEIILRKTSGDGMTMALARIK